MHKRKSVLRHSSTFLIGEVKGEMSLRNGMWHGLRNDIIMRNVIYAERPKEIN